MKIRSFHKIMIASAVFLICGLLVGWVDSWDQIRQVSAGVTSIQADFVQSKQLKILSRPLVSEGRFVFRKPDSLRWEYRSPVRSVLLLSQGDVKRYIQRNGRLVEDSPGRAQVMKVILPEIAAWSQGRFNESRTFSARLLPGRKTRILLTPKEKSLEAMIQSVEVTLSERPGVIDAVRIIENAESGTTIQFKNVQTNRKLDPVLFRAA